MENTETTALDALIGEMLGDVGQVHREVKALRAEIPEAAREFLTVADGLADRLTKAVLETVELGREAARLAGDAAVRKAADDRIHALIEEAAVATADMRLAADGAAASLKRSVAKVSIWRQVAFCVASGAVSGFVIFGLLGIFGQGADRFFVRSVALTASSLPAEDLKSLGSGRMIRGVWPRLSAQCQAEITTASAAAGKAR
jgi:hypothetical protein